MTETPEQRAKRLGLIASSAAETPAARAARLGLNATTAPSASSGEDGSDTRGYGRRLVSTLLNAAEGIPGMEAVEAGAGALGSKLTDSPMSYAESLNTLRNETGDIGAKRAFAGKMLGSIAVAPFLPAGAVKAGATLGAADQALAADPITSGTDVLKRAGKTALGAGAGALTGKLLEGGVTGARMVGATKTEPLLFAKQAARAESAKTLYGAAMTEGRAHEVTPAIEQFLAEPDIAPIVARIREGRTGAQADIPEVLDLVYKDLSDQARAVGKPLLGVEPTRPNIAASRGKDITAAKRQALGAMSEPPAPRLTAEGLPASPESAYMPSYEKAVEDYATRTAEMKDIGRGNDAMVDAVAGRGGAQKSKTILRGIKNETSPTAFKAWAGKADEDAMTAAMRGILGAARSEAGAGVRPAFHAALKAGPVLRAVQTPQQRAIEALINAGLLTANQFSP